MTQHHPQNASVPYHHLEGRKKKAGRKATTANPARTNPPEPPTALSPQGGRRTPPPAARRGPGPPERLPARAHLGRRGALAAEERGSDRCSRRRPEPPAPARPRGARRCRPLPRAAARCRVAGRCPARLLSHSALCHSLALSLSPFSFERESPAQISEPALPSSAGTDITRPGLLTPSRARRRDRWGGQRPAPGAGAGALCPWRRYLLPAHLATSAGASAEAEGAENAPVLTGLPAAARSACPLPPLRRERSSCPCSGQPSCSAKCLWAKPSGAGGTPGQSSGQAVGAGPSSLGKSSPSLQSWYSQTIPWP